MICPNCESNCSKILETREAKKYRRRRYICRECGFRWTTVEIKKDKYLELASLSKALSSVKKATEAGKTTDE